MDRAIVVKLEGSREQLREQLERVKQEFMVALDDPCFSMAQCIQLFVKVSNLHWALGKRALE